MSGPRAASPCPTCRHLAANGKVCHAADSHPFKNGVCRAYQPSTYQPNNADPLNDPSREDAR